MSKNFPSPQQSPRDDLNINGSTYALQVALRNMKERYHKLQRKLSFIEEENQRLVHGKTELFGEIGVMQEGSIKLREKNLQLNQEIHSKHQENCSLRDSYNSISHQNMTLSRDNRRLYAQINQLMEEDRTMKQRDDLPTDNRGVEGSAIDAPHPEGRLSPDSISPALPASDSDDSIDSLGQQECRQESYSSLFSVSEDGSDRMDVIMDEVQRQSFALRELMPFLAMFTGDVSPTGTLLSQRDRDLSTLTVGDNNRLLLTDESAVCSKESKESEDIVTGDDGEDEQSDDSIDCDGDVTGSPVRPNTLHSKQQDGVVTSSTGQPGVAAYISHGFSILSRQRSTPDVSPTTHQLFPGGSLHDDSKICPMCNQVFSKEVTQDMFENHVVAHFEDIDVGFEVV